jgi:transcriptional regulator with GAF, ATPase, and Fis domain
MKSKMKKPAFEDADAINRHITNISNTVTPARSRKELMDSMKKELRAIVDADSSYIAVYDKDYLSCSCFTENLLPQISNQTFTCSGAVTHTIPFTFRFNDADENLYTQIVLAGLHRDAGFRSACVIPLRMQGLLMGYLFLASFREDHFTPSLLPVFEKIAEPITIGVSNVLLYEKLQMAQSEIERREQEKTRLLAVSQAVASIRDQDDLFRMVVERIQPIFGFEVGAQIFTADLSDGTATVFFPNMFSAIPDFEHRFSIRGTPIETVMLTGEIFPIYRESDYPDFPLLRMMKSLHISGAMIAPLRIGGSIIGTFQVFSNRREVLSADQYPLFQAIADQLAVAVSNILSHEKIAQLNNELVIQNNYLIEEVQGHHNFEEIISQSKLLDEIFSNIHLVSRTDTTVLLMGETGTGKELFARAIHKQSTRQSKPLIRLNCAALPAQLIESELFGHERGAFTGAIDKRIGKFEVADGGTLFLDEIGELPLELQAKLLRALQEKEIERLGSNKVIKTNVRIIAATNRDLGKEVAAGRFRPDLFFRLNVFPIQLPPLRDRKEDIPLLAAHFIKKMEKKLGRELRGMSSKVLQQLMAYSWPGNVRELEHVIERSAIVSKGNIITALHLPDPPGEPPVIITQTWALKTWKEHEKEYILQVLSQTNGRISGEKGAARILDIPPTTLESKMRKLGIRKRHYPMG